MNPRDAKVSAENKAEDDFSSTPVVVKLKSLKTAQLCQLFDHCYLHNFDDFVYRHKLTGIHLQDGVDNIQDLLEMGLHKLAAKALYKRITAWKVEGLPRDFNPTLTEPTPPIHRESSASDATGQTGPPTKFADENKVDDDFVDTIADFDHDLGEPTLPIHASDSACVSCPSEEIPASNVTCTATFADKVLDDDFVAARYCCDRAAIDRIIAAADNGNHLAEAYLSSLYYRDGTLVGLDRAKAETIAAQALPWLTEYADTGNAYAQFNLAMCYLDGRGVTKNEQETARLARLAAEHDLAAAQSLLGWCYEFGAGVTKNETEALLYYKLAADQGHANAQCNLASCYVFGNGVNKDKIKAMRYFQLAADQGHVKAQYSLGVWCGIRSGVSQNLVKAVQYYTLAADKGLMQAQYYLGVCYERGNGVSTDKAKAIKYYKLAAAQNDTDAQRKLDQWEKEGGGKELG